MMRRVFLGGTCNNSTWRDELKKQVSIEMFNPVVENWTKECYDLEMVEKEDKCDIHLYVITSRMKNVFSIAEVMDSVHNQSKTTIFQVIPDGFDEGNMKSLQAVVDLVKYRGGIAYVDSKLERTANILNTMFT